MKLRQRGIVSFVMFKKNDEDVIRSIKNTAEDLLQKNLVLSDTGHTYLLADVLRLSPEEIAADTELQVIKILTRDGQSIGLSALQVAMQSEDVLLKNLAYNRQLADALLSINLRMLTMSIPLCPLSRGRVVKPVLEDAIEESYLQRYVRDHGEGVGHPLFFTRKLYSDKIVSNHALKELVYLFDSLRLAKLHRLKEKNDPKFAGSIQALEDGVEELNQILKAQISDILHRNNNLESYIEGLRIEYDMIQANNSDFNQLSIANFDSLQRLIHESKSTYEKLREYTFADLFPHSYLAFIVRAGIGGILGEIIPLIYLLTHHFSGLKISESLAVIYGSMMILGLVVGSVGIFLDKFSANKIEALNRRDSDIEKVKTFRGTLQRVTLETTKNAIILRDTQERLFEFSGKPKSAEDKKPQNEENKGKERKSITVTASGLGKFSPPKLRLEVAREEQKEEEKESLLRPLNMFPSA